MQQPHLLFPTTLRCIPVNNKHKSSYLSYRITAYRAASRLSLHPVVTPIVRTFKPFIVVILRHHVNFI